MIKKLILRLCLMMAVMLSLFSCRNDLLPENNNLQNPNASRFRMVKLKDIPNVEQFIHQQSGRADLQVPLSEASLTGKDLTVGVIEISTIVETVNEGETYYVFKIENLNSGDAVYNLEVKQADGIPVTAEIIEYDPQDGTTVDFQHFTGSISSYGLDGKAISTVNYNDGLGNCSPATGVPGGNNTSEGGGINPIDLPPPNGGWYNWEEGGSNNNTVPFSNVPGDCTDIILDSHGNTQGWYDHCNNNYYPNPNVHKTTTTGEIPNLSPDCNGEGAGVIIISNEDITTCEKVKATTNNLKFKVKKDTLATKTHEDHEYGFSYELPYGGIGGEYRTLDLYPNDVFINFNAYITSQTFIHSHIDKMYPIFSPEDVIRFNEWVNWVNSNNAVPNPDNIPLPNATNISYTVVTSQGSYMLTFDGATDFNIFPAITQTQIDDLIKDYIEFINKGVTGTDSNGNYTYNTVKVEGEFLKFINKNLKMNGLKVFRINDNERTELRLENNIRKEYPCP
ncbi:hypothetical protein N0B16_12225 [Chryseobacterium sp. GMJ5]|uniref:Uncharacterized protein n=1 Tax=Chryseobacterium gilvum TaxID=2976534 RepID=A0ABT2VYX8_9FLAO|nr:hypothetical protein [Chryseobacterium gilvum]MCU7615206.1 hypothetical protein [Chryseobacterium gilvum]